MSSKTSNLSNFSPPNMLGYSCQRCHQSLKLDESLVDLAPSTYDMISSTMSTPPSASTSSPQRTLPDPNILSRLPPVIRAAYPLPGTSKASGMVPKRFPSVSVGSSSRIGRTGIGATIGIGNKRVILVGAANEGGFSERTMDNSSKELGKEIGEAETAKKDKDKETEKPQLPGPAESFVFLSESTITSLPPAVTSAPSVTSPSLPPTPSTSKPPLPNSSISSHLSTTSNLFALLSSSSSIDHPLCEECSDALLGMINKALEEKRKERDRYRGFEAEVLRRREKGRDGGKAERDRLKNEGEKLKKTEELTTKELDKLGKERDSLAVELKALEEEERKLELEEAQFWKDHNEYLLQLDAYNQRSRSTIIRYEHDVRELEKLQKTNVYNDAFCIGHDGGLPTINGLRLGRLPSVPVDWPEINAAWGQTLLLLVTIARKLDCVFENYRPIPLGSFSKIERLSDHSILELYGSSEFVNRLFQNRRFDHAMVAFLDLLRQLMDKAVERDREKREAQRENIGVAASGRTGLRLHHQVNKDRIGDVSIKLQFGSEENWTRALRHVLLNVKILLAFASET